MCIQQFVLLWTVVLNDYREFDSSEMDFWFVKKKGFSFSSNSEIYGSCKRKGKINKNKQTKRQRIDEANHLNK